MPTYLYGKVLEFDTVNKNNRLYPKDEVLKAVDEFNKKSVKLSEVFLSTSGTKLINQLSELTSPQFMLSLRGDVSPLVTENSGLQVRDLNIISIDVLPFDGSDQSMICQVQKCPNK